ncbi:MAG: hypothetical protein EU544_01600 [Promethearchaeota archaeon]|nr:MAG: hypothetical protein EU544_01600 [Candidatus Lokiarchaeota archaeon]
MAFQSKNKNSKMLLFGGLMGFFAGMLWLGPTADFFSVILTGDNLPNEKVYGVLTFMWVSPLLVVTMFVGGDLMLTKKNKHILVGISTIIGVIFEIFLFTDTDAAIKNYPDPKGRELYDASIVIGHPTSYLILIGLAFLFTFVVIGGYRQGLQTTGILRKRFFYMATAIFLFIPIAIIDAFYEPVLIVLGMRLLMVFVASLMYLSLKINM